MLLFISTIHKQPHLQISSSSSILSLLALIFVEIQTTPSENQLQMVRIPINFSQIIYICLHFAVRFFEWLSIRLNSISFKLCNLINYYKIWYGSFVFVGVVVSCWAGGMQIDNQEGEGKWLAHNAAEKPILWSMYGPSGTEEEWEERVLYGLQYWIL